MRMQNVSDQAYALNWKGGSKADPGRYPTVEVRTTQHCELRFKGTRLSTSQSVRLPVTIP